MAEHAPLELLFSRLHEFEPSLFQAALNAVPFAVAWKDPHGTYQGCNLAFATDVGAPSPADIVGRTDADMPWQDQAARIREADASIVASGAAVRGVEDVRHRPDGSLQWLRLSRFPRRGPDSAIQGLVVVQEDITQLVQSRELFLQAFHAIPVPVVISRESDGIVLEINAVGAATLGRAIGEIIGRSTLELGLWPEGSARAETLQRLRSGERIQDQPHRLVDAQGRTHVGLISLVPVSLHGTSCLLALFHDQTSQQAAEAERERLQLQLIQSQKLEAVGQLAGGVAHDFNNILAAIMLQLELLGLDPGLSPSVREAIDELTAEAKRGANLTRQLLLFSRREVARHRPLELNELVRNLLKMLRRLIGEHLALDLIPSPSPLWVEADPGMIEQVVMNLVVNARDALPRGGHIVIALSQLLRQGDLQKHNPNARPGLHACLAVSDDGCGMDAATLARIFEPFFTTKEAGRGTGLGLATVYGIVNQHAGWVEVDSAVGRGSVFRVFLPCSTHAQRRQPESSRAAPLPSGAHECILLVEDNASVRRTAGILLRQRGFDVIEAPNGKTAIEAWDRNASRIRLVITDLVMPEGIMGADLLARFLSQVPDLRAILMSGYSADLDAQRNLPPQCQFLRKPFDAPELLSAVHRSLAPSANPPASPAASRAQ